MDLPWWVHLLSRDSVYAGKLWDAVRLGVCSICDYISERYEHDWSGRRNAASAHLCLRTREGPFWHAIKLCAYPQKLSRSFLT